MFIQHLLKKKIDKAALYCRLTTTYGAKKIAKKTHSFCLTQNWNWDIRLYLLSCICWYGSVHNFTNLILFNLENSRSRNNVEHFTQGGGGRCLQGNPWYSPPASMTSRLASVTFKMASKVFIEETDKNFDFITEILFRFLGFGDFKVSIVIEN